MKKVYLSTALMFLAGLSFAQMSVQRANEHFTPEKKGVPTRPVHQSNIDRGPGDNIVTDDFSNFSNWDISQSINGHAWDTLLVTPSTVTNFIGTMNSTTAANGFAFFNGIDLLLNAQTTPFGEQEAILEYVPTINCSGIAGVIVEFEQRYRRFNSDSIWIDVDTTIAGGNWNSIYLGADFGRNAPSSSQTTETVNISEFAGNSPNVKIRFRWTGGSDQQFGAGYGWFIDDFRVYEAWDFESALTTTKFRKGVGGQVFLDGLDYHMFPLSQTSPIEFSGEILSNGGVPQTGSFLQVDITGAETFSTTSPTSSIQVAAVDSFVCSNTFEPTTEGTYNVTFTADQTGTDVDLSNNTESITFDLTDGIYSRDDGNETGGIRNVTSNPGGALAIGNMMEIFSDATVVAMDVVLANDNNSVGQFIYGTIYRFDANASAYVEVAVTKEHEVTAGDLNGNPVRLLMFDDEYFDVFAGDDLLVMAAHFGGTDGEEVEFAYAQSVQANTVRGVTADGNQFVLNNPNAIMVRLVLPKPSSIEETEVSNISVGQNVPNPFTENTLITYSLNEAANVTLDIVDVTGKVVSTINEGIQAAGEHNVTINASDLSDGVYFYNFRAGDYSVTKRMVVNK